MSVETSRRDWVWHDSQHSPVARHTIAACVLEATARKPGNVHPGAAFVDVTYGDFVQSAYLIAPALARGAEWGVGRIVLDAVQTTHRALGRNTNLGIVLLFAPLACVPAGICLRDGIGEVLSRLNDEVLGRAEAERVYAAIRLARPGGLGQVERGDVSAAPSTTLLEAMRLAADRDRIAKQYVTDFSAVFAGVDRLTSSGGFSQGWENAVIGLHLWLMSEFPDTLISRKCGTETAAESARQAGAAIRAGWPESESGRRIATELDAWLRAAGNRRNPGTTADLVAACLFAAFRDGSLELPPMPGSADAFIPAGPVE